MKASYFRKLVKKHNYYDSKPFNVYKGLSSFMQDELNDASDEYIMMSSDENNGGYMVAEIHLDFRIEELIKFGYLIYDEHNEPEIDWDYYDGRFAHLLKIKNIQ